MSDDPPGWDEAVRKAQEAWDADPDPTRVWTTDAHGNRVMRGLTVDETEEFERLRGVERRGDDRARYLELRNKHEIERIRAVSAEVEARQERKH